MFIQAGSQLRLFASANDNGRKRVKNNGTVNKNSRAKKLIQDNDPPLTIFPFALNELQNLQSKAKTTNKIEKPAIKIEKPDIVISNDGDLKDLKKTQEKTEIINKIQEIVI